MKNKKTTIIISIIITAFLVLMFKNEHFALDTYVFSNDIGYSSSSHLSNGNIFMYLFLKICLAFNLTAKNIKLVSLILSLVSLFLSNIVLSKLLSKETEKDFEVGLISSAIIYSPFIFEFYLFPEITGIIGLSILFCMLSVVFINKFFENRDNFNLILSIIFGICSVLSYHDIFGLFVIVSIFLSIINYKEKGLFIKENIYTFIVYILSFVPSIIIGISKVSFSNYNFINSIKNIFKGIYNLFTNASSVLPNNFFLLITLMSLILIIFQCIKNKEKNKILPTIYLLIISLVISAIPHLFVNYNDIWIVARNSICIGVIPYVLFALYFCINGSTDKYKIISVIIILLSFVLQLIGWYQIREDHYYTNVADRTDATEIINNIKQYEFKNDVEIKKIAFAYDSNIKYAYDEVFVSIYDVNVRAFTKPWAIENIINYYSDKKYEFVDASKELIDYCSKNNWEEIRTPMFEYKDDTLYMCVY